MTRKMRTSGTPTRSETRPKTTLVARSRPKVRRRSAVEASSGSMVALRARRPALERAAPADHVWRARASAHPLRPCRPMALPDRRAFMATCAGLGVGATLFPGVLWAKMAAGAEITKETVAAAAELAGLTFDDAEREMMVAGLRDQARQLATLHAIALANAVAPAVQFNPLPANTTIGEIG